MSLFLHLEVELLSLLNDFYKVSMAYLRFYNRTQYFRDDCEFIDILKSNIELIAGENEVLRGIAPIKHATYKSIYNNTPHARGLSVSHLRYTLYSSFIKELYEETTEYFKYILLCGARNTTNSRRIVGEHKVNFDANYLLSKSSYDEIINAIIQNIFEQLENERSTTQLINKIKNKLGLIILDDTINQALPYLLLRHILVHSDGKPNDEFKQQYPQFAINRKGRCDLKLKHIADELQP